MTEQKRSNLPWILAGCGVLLLFGCCLSTGVVGVVYYRGQKAEQLERFAEMERRAVEQRHLMEEEQRRLAETPTVPQFVGTPSVTVIARVTRATGRRITTRVGSMCMFQVEYPERNDQPGVRWCHTVARCSGVALYGGTTNGFFPCTFSDSPASVRGSDAETTSGDRDGAFSIDTGAGTLSIRDDSAGERGEFSIDATITRAM